MVGSNDTKVKAVAGKTYGHLIVLTKAGDLYSAGRNSYGQLGDGSTSNKRYMQPIFPTGKMKFDSIAAGYDFSMALTADGKLYSWGRNNYGQLGLGHRTNKTTPTHVTPGIKYLAMSAGENTSMAINGEGRLYIWGRNNYGQYGNGLSGSSTSKYVPWYIPLS
jgi:alpha-tubulin suppressor-like RCC1 family protein